MKKIDYTIPGKDELLKKVHGYFDGIDEVIKELASEGNQLGKELSNLEESAILTADNLKKKAEIKQKIVIIRKSLDEAITERKKIQSKYWNEIREEATDVEIKYNASIRNQLLSKQKEVFEIIDKAEAVLKEIQEIKNKRNHTLNAQIINPINTTVKEDEEERKLLNHAYYSNTEKLEKIIEQKNGGYSYNSFEI